MLIHFIVKQQTPLPLWNYTYCQCDTLGFHMHVMYMLLHKKMKVKCTIAFWATVYNQCDLRLVATFIMWWTSMFCFTL